MLPSNNLLIEEASSGLVNLNKIIEYNMENAVTAKVGIINWESFSKWSLTFLVET
ncbi:hypothetical protein [Hydrocoleum sp. CS-953]|uniref:hypothetical protein n=1 Tax=Hydrocoleum sp. CS-953 TaxID=1671698 RepID=UPI001AEFBEF9|nr:hypothetical protein [Hydrocoleum sp. CS-953]